MTAFAAMVGALFADPNMTVEATWTGGFGATATVRGILRRPDVVESFGEGRVQTGTTVLDVQTSALPLVQKDHVVTVAGRSMIVCAAPMRDKERLVTTLMLRPET